MKSVIVLLIVLGGAAAAADRQVDFLCGHVNYWTPCEQVKREYEMREAERRRLLEQQAELRRQAEERQRRAAPVEPEGEVPPAVDDEMREDWQRYQLFPRESLAQDAPEAFAVLLEKPTIENAIIYWKWYEARQERLKDVQDLIARAGQMVALERGLPVPHVDDSGRGLVPTQEDFAREVPYSATLR